MDERANRLPNLNAGHLAGCITEAVYSGVENTPPVLIVASCQEGCPHLTLELEGS
jgi:hypothetical protein